MVVVVIVVVVGVEMVEVVVAVVVAVVVVVLGVVGWGWLLGFALCYSLFLLVLFSFILRCIIVCLFSLVSELSKRFFY